MPIETINYVYNSSSPSVPRIVVDVSSSTTEELASAVSAYRTDSESYAKEYEALGSQHEYVMGRLEKDACSEAGLAKIDLTKNTYVASIKADNYFAEAKKGARFSDKDGIDKMIVRLKSMKEQLFDDETLPGTAGGWDNTKTLASAVYDGRAITVSNSVLTEESGDTIFIPSIPNATGNDRKFSSYSGTQDFPEKDYSISYENGKWCLKNLIGETVKVTDDIDSEMIAWGEPSVAA